MERLSDRPAHPAARPLPGPARGENRLIAAREKLGLAVLAVERARRGTLARVRRSRLLLWRHRAPIADDLVLAPPDLRLQDPSFAEEVASGSMGLAGLTAALAGNSPFALHPPDPAWARELNGFGWLRHFAADRTLENEAVARRLVQDWIATTRRRNAHAWAPDIVGRRIISWLSHASLILDGAERRPYRAVMLSLEDQATYLSASWRNAPDGYPRLVALIGLTQAGLCIAGHERRLPAAEKCLAAELERQILADGGHVSRNPAVLLELLLDLLPLRQCFAAHTRKPDEALTAAIQRMMPMLSRLRLGDGQLGRFNGMGITERDALATVLAYDTGGHVEHATGSTASGYVRLARGATVVLLDAGAAPPLALAGEACAGCLSFELSTGGSMLLVNAGAPGPAHGTLRASSRGTSCHNTLELGGQSSSKLVRARGLGTGASIQHPDHVTCGVGGVDDTAGGGIVLKASHDGYRDRFGLIHTRTLALDPAGNRLEGRDQLDGGDKGELRFSWDVPFAVHFHLHPRASARLADGDKAAVLILPGGERWRLSASGAALTIEESTHFADVRGPLKAQQVVLRAVCYGAADVSWTLERLGSLQLESEESG